MAWTQSQQSALLSTSHKEIFISLCERVAIAVISKSRTKGVWIVNMFTHAVSRLATLSQTLAAAGTGPNLQMRRAVQNCDRRRSARLRKGC